MAQKRPKQQERFQGKRERYIQPSILLGLYLKPSYGYELIQEIQRYGFVEGPAPPGMIYRHLRQLEDQGLVLSEPGYSSNANSEKTSSSLIFIKDL